MPINKNNLSRGRVDFTHSLSDEEVESLAADPGLKILQTSAPVDAETWDLLNDGLFALRSDVELRVYGFYSTVCDLSFLRRLPNVRRFLADCLMDARGVEHIASLKNLESLSVGIYSLASFDFLEDLPHKNLAELSLGPTKSQTLTGLQSLSLRSLTKIHAIPDLSQLGALRRIYLENMKGLEDIRPLETAPALEELIHGSAMGMEPQHYMRLLKSKTLRALSVGFGNAKKNKILEDLANQAGLKPYQFSEFCFA
jgi:hypothetical protein